MKKNRVQNGDEQLKIRPCSVKKTWTSVKKRLFI